MKNKKVFLSFLFLSLLFSGCASIVSDSKYAVRITTNSPNSTVVVRKKNGELVAQQQAPALVLLDSGRGYFLPARYVVEVSAPGMNPAVCELSASFDYWYLGNVFPFPFLIPLGMLIVDPLTGAMWKMNSHLQLDTTRQNLNQIDDVFTPISDKAKEQLNALNSLFDAGLLSKDEYEVKRATLIEKL